MFWGTYRHAVLFSGQTRITAMISFRFANPSSKGRIGVLVLKSERSEPFRDFGNSTESQYLSVVFVVLKSFRSKHEPGRP